MPRYLKGLWIVALALWLTNDSAVAQTLTEKQKDALVFGSGVTTGKVLVENLKNVCQHVRDVIASADPTRRTLLLADQKMKMFDAQPCVGICDQLQVNNLVVRCRRERDIAGCVIYGAVYQKQVYSFSIDQTGFNLETDCAR